MKLTQLEYFCQVYRLGSVSRAAKALNMTQPSISAAIRELETEFGLTLFAREGRGIRPTGQGDIFYEHAQSLLTHAESFSRTMAGLSRQEEIRLGVPPMIGSLVLPALYGEYQASRQGCALKIVEGGRGTLMEMLENHRIDLALLPHNGRLSRFETEAIGTMETMCCVSGVHPLRKRRSLSVQDLAQEPLVLFSDSFFQTEQILERFRSAGLEPNVLLQSNQLSTISQMVARNIAVGFVFNSVAEGIPDVVPIPLSPKMNFHVSLAWNPDTPVTPGKKLIIDLFSQIKMINKGESLCF